MSRTVLLPTLSKNPCSSDSGIHSIPNDLLREVFLQTAASWSNDPEYSHPALAISWVSSHWRSIVLQIPQMWSYIRIDRPNRGTYEALFVFLKRSTPLPIDFNINCTIPKAHGAAYAYLKNALIVIQKQEILDRVCQLTLVLPSHLDNDFLKPWFLKSQWVINRLKSLKVIQHDPSDSGLLPANLNGVLVDIRRLPLILPGEVFHHLELSASNRQDTLRVQLNDSRFWENVTTLSLSYIDIDLSVPTSQQPIWLRHSHRRMKSVAFSHAAFIPPATPEEFRLFPSIEKFDLVEMDAQPILRLLGRDRMEMIWPSMDTMTVDDFVIV